MPARGHNEGAMGDDVKVKGRLFQATDTLAEELLFIKSSLASYCVIGLNASKIESGKLIFGHLQRLCLLSVALGLAKVFEREKERGNELCSVSGVLRLAKMIPIEDITALHTFAATYGVEPQDSWVSEIDEVFAKQRSTIARHAELWHRLLGRPVPGPDGWACAGDLDRPGQGISRLRGAPGSSPPAGHYAVSSERGRSNDLPTMALGDLRELPLVYRPDRAVHQLLE
jgi:hypothetical protein